MVQRALNGPRSAGGELPSGTKCDWQASGDARHADRRPLSFRRRSSQKLDDAPRPSCGSRKQMNVGTTRSKRIALRGMDGRVNARMGKKSVGRCPGPEGRIRARNAGKPGRARRADSSVVAKRASATRRCWRCRDARRNVPSPRSGSCVRRNAGETRSSSTLVGRSRAKNQSR